MGSVCGRTRLDELEVVKSQSQQIVLSSPIRWWSQVNNQRWCRVLLSEEATPNAHVLFGSITLTQVVTAMIHAMTHGEKMYFKVRLSWLVDRVR